MYQVCTPPLQVHMWSINCAPRPSSMKSRPSWLPLGFFVCHLPGRATISDASTCHAILGCWGRCRGRCLMKGILATWSLGKPLHCHRCCTYSSEILLVPTKKTRGSSHGLWCMLVLVFLGALNAVYWTGRLQYSVGFRKTLMRNSLQGSKPIVNHSANALAI